MKLSRYHVLSPPVVDGKTGDLKCVIFATRTAEARLISPEAWALIESGQFEQLPREVLTELVDIEILVPDEQDELRLVLQRNQAAIADDDNLYLVVQPTAWCQLGCGYCGQQHFQKRISDADQRLFVERTRKKLEAKRYKTLELSWFGGEPLAAMDVIRALSPQLMQLALEFDVLYTAKVVTNGLNLTPAVATELVGELGIGSIEVTLDGIAPFHDVRRHTKTGKGTFDRIYSNVVALAKRDDLAVNLTVRCNVDRRNYEGVSPLLHMLAEDGVQRRLSFYVAPVHSWGNSAHLESLSSEEFSKWEIKSLAEMVQLGFNPKILPNRRPIVCMAVSPDSELVDANGDLFNCTEVSYVPKYGAPNRYAIGNLATGEMPGKRDVLGDLNDRIDRGEYDCGACRMLPVCGGRCPKLWQEGIVPCPSTKFNIESRLLVKYAMSRLQDGANAAKFDRGGVSAK